MIENAFDVRRPIFLFLRNIFQISDDSNSHVILPINLQRLQGVQDLSQCLLCSLHFLAPDYQIFINQSPLDVFVRAEMVPVRLLVGDHLPLILAHNGFNVFQIWETI